ncbi:MAG: LacI family DNA-binding transcriptional regulator [Clostridiales bacterium]|nr:LacI family DNA-binding transcriptional regulator [Clostridiales bacterium]
MSATIKDVARLSNVSIATVSKYLNGGNVKEENRINIENAIDKLDYRVNNFARSLKINRAMTIGIVVDSITNTFYTGIISVIEEFLNEKGYASIVCETKENDDIRRKRMDFLLRKGVDGFIIFTTNISADFLDYYIKKGAAIVVVDSIADGVDCDFVTSDNISGAYQATEHFILKGHKKIAIITGEEENFSAGERLKGYKNAMKDHKIPIFDRYIYKNSYDLEGGYNSFKKIISDKKNMPTAVLISNYFMAVGAIIAINENNISIPDDISIICFDDLELSKVFKPKLTSVSQSSKGIGMNAAKMLLDRIDSNNKIGTRTVRVPVKITVNDSIKAL